MPKQQKQATKKPRLSWLPPGQIERQAALGLTEDPIDNKKLAAACCRCHGQCQETLTTADDSSHTVPKGCFAPMSPPQPGEWLYTGHAGEGERHGQSYPEYVRGKRGERRRKFPSQQSRNTIYLVNLDEREENNLDTNARAMEFMRRFVVAFFGLAAKILPPLAKSERRNLVIRSDPLPQYLTGPIHSLLRRRKGKLKDAFAVMGVTLVDLYPEMSWNFVFGEANADKGVGVFSLARYHPEFEKQWDAMFADALREDGPLSDANDESEQDARPIRAKPIAPWSSLHGEEGGTLPNAAPLFWKRALKVLCHEIGHLFHKEHCVYYNCLMNGCQTLPELDKSPLHLCPVCLRKLNYSISDKGRQSTFDVLERYQSISTCLKEDLGLVMPNASPGVFGEELSWFQGALVQCTLYRHSENMTAARDPDHDDNDARSCLCSLVTGNGELQDQVAEEENGQDKGQSSNMSRTNTFSALFLEEDDSESE